MCANICQCICVVREENQRNVGRSFTHFCRILKDVLCTRSLVSRGRNDQLKPSESLNLIERIGSETIHFLSNCFDIQESVVFQTPCVCLNVSSSLQIIFEARS